MDPLICPGGERKGTFGVLQADLALTHVVVEQAPTYMDQTAHKAAQVIVGLPIRPLQTGLRGFQQRRHPLELIPHLGDEGLAHQQSRVRLLYLGW